MKIERLLAVKPLVAPPETPLVLPPLVLPPLVLPPQVLPPQVLPLLALPLLALPLVDLLQMVATLVRPLRNSSMNSVSASA